jgi:hypothetical protein
MYALNPDGSLKWKQDIWANFWPFYAMAKNGDLYIALLDTMVIIASDGTIKNSIYIPSYHHQ